MTIKNISVSVIHEFQMVMDINYLYSIRLWLPKDANSTNVAKYISMCYPYYHVRARETGINHLGENLPILSILTKKNFEIKYVFQNIDTNAMANILIDAYQTAKKHVTHLRSIRFWLPKNSNSKQLANYIEKNSDYQAHAKENIVTPHGHQLPSLVIGSKEIIK